MYLVCRHRLVLFCKSWQWPSDQSEQTGFKNKTGKNSFSSWHQKLNYKPMCRKETFKLTFNTFIVKKSSFNCTINNLNMRKESHSLTRSQQLKYNNSVYRCLKLFPSLRSYFSPTLRLFSPSSPTNYRFKKKYTSQM